VNIFKWVGVVLVALVATLYAARDTQLVANWHPMFVEK